jgi:hypothetical protein
VRLVHLPVAALLWLAANDIAHAAPESHVRVIFIHEWHEEMINDLSASPPLLLDTVVSFSALPPEMTPREFFALAARHAGRGDYPQDFVHTMSVYRRNEPDGRYSRVERRRVHKKATFLDLLRDGDVVVFHSIIDRF